MIPTKQNHNVVRIHLAPNEDDVNVFVHQWARPAPGQVQVNGGLPAGPLSGAIDRLRENQGVAGRLFGQNWGSGSGVSSGVKAVTPAVAAYAPKILNVSAPVVTGITGPVGLVLSGIMNGKSLISSIDRIYLLVNILDMFEEQAMQGTREAIRFAIYNKCKKSMRKASAIVASAGFIPTPATPVLLSVGGLVALQSAGSHIYKTILNTKGRDRKLHSKKLWDNHLAGCRLAKTACRILLGDPDFFLIKDYEDGHMAIFIKMAST